MDVKISPSILSADFGKLNEEIASIENHADYIHVDVMDGHFVPNITIGPAVIRYIKSKRPLDVHLMIESPEKYVEEFVTAGADILTVHYEVFNDTIKVHQILKHIKTFNIKAGISIKPQTPVEVLKDVLPELDWVLIMSVEPGFGGQEFMDNSLEKITWLRNNAPSLDIAVDGGINDITGRKCIKAGANILIAGSYIFHAEDRIEAIELLRDVQDAYTGT